MKGRQSGNLTNVAVWIRFKCEFISKAVLFIRTDSPRFPGLPAAPEGPEGPGGPATPI